MRLYRYLIAGSMALMTLSALAQPTPNPPQSPPYDNQYVQGPDSLPQTDIPRGKTFRFTFDHSRIFPGTSRTITVYIPAEYKADGPACVYVGLDSIETHVHRSDLDFDFSIPTVFDNLIAKHQMPVTIAIGIEPGTVASAGAPDNPRYNRSFEFDALNDDLARFLVDEVFPEVERHKTPDGLPIILSKDPNDHAAGGVSTGGIGAFTLAWERPDLFRRVFISIGTFVGMRGGDRYPVLVRKTEPKPIRIFMQDGSHDGLDGFLGEVGDWWMSNQAMERALTFAGYQVEHVWGEGTHDPRHMAAIFPEAMRFLWKDWPRPVTTGQSKNVFVQDVLLPGAGWEEIRGDYRATGPIAVDSAGDIVFEDSNGISWKISDGDKPAPFSAIGKSYAGIAFGPDTRAYAVDSEARVIRAFGPGGRVSIIVRGIRGNALTVSHNDLIYVTEPGTRDDTGKVWLIDLHGKKRLLDSGLHRPAGIALSPDGFWLTVAESSTHWAYSYRVESDGRVTDKERLFWFHVADEDDNSGAGGLASDRDGRLYAATRMGVQVFDRNGRSRLILPTPGGEAVDLAFGGRDFDMLYVVCSDHRLYRRKLKVHGAPSFAAPTKLPAWMAG